MERISNLIDDEKLRIIGEKSYELRKGEIIRKYLVEEKKIEVEITRQLKIKEELKKCIDKLLMEGEK